MPVLQRVVVLLLLVAFAACGGAGSAGRDHAGEGSDAGGHGNEGVFSFGQPGDTGVVDRQLDVVANGYDFTPAEFDVKVGQVIAFTVRNEDRKMHEFVLGDVEFQEEHETEMDSGDMADSDNAFVLMPGETKTLTWEFSTEGQVLYACHVDDHYERGMVGTILVE